MEPNATHGIILEKAKKKLGDYRALTLFFLYRFHDIDKYQMVDSTSALALQGSGWF